MKNELEICVKCLNTKEEVIDKLQNQGFKIKEDFTLKDIYYVKKDKVNNFVYEMYSPLFH